MTQIPRRRHLLGVAACVALFSVAIAGCSSDESDPAQERRERVETRLGETFSKDQADCIVATIDEDTLRALDRTVDLPPDSPQMFIYSVAVRACVEDPNSASTTTTSDSTASTASTTSEG